MSESSPAVLNAIATLAGELWVTKDRLHVIEAVLAEQGLDISAAVSTYQPDAAMTAKLDREREQFIADVMQGFLQGSTGQISTEQSSQQD